MSPLAVRYLQSATEPTRPRHRDVVQFLRDDDGLARQLRGLTIARRLVAGQHMQPTAAAETWDLPVITTVGALADWLGLTVG